MGKSGPLAEQASRRQPAAGRQAAGVSVVIVTYRNAADFGGCLAAVRNAAPVAPVDVIVVDNASGDEHRGRLAARRYQGVTVL